MFSSRLWNLFIDSFPKMFIRGLTVTIPLTAIAFSLAMVIAVIVALVQFANIKVLKQYGVSVLVQCIDFHVKGYFIGSDYYRNGNV